jgi:short-subunit dehydrogenase
MKLTNKTILITGASSGIGYELAMQLAEKGNRMIVLARRKNLLDALCTSLDVHPQGHLAYECDVSQASEIGRVCKDIVNLEIGVDVLILNAGVGGTFHIKNMDVEQIRYLFEVNLFSQFQFIKFFLPFMLKKNEGMIVTVGSLAGYRGMPKSAPYSASKAAVMRLIESLRIDLWGSGIKCVLVSPGFVETPMTEQNRFKMPFMLSAKKAARKIVNGMVKEKPEIHFPLALSLLAKASLLFPYNWYAKTMQGRK